MSDSQPRAMHLRPRAVLAVATGGLLGALARYALDRLLPSPPPGWPTGTLVANLTGVFLLGLLLEVLSRSGPDCGWRQQLRLLVGTGFCGALTTYSTLAVETDLLARRGHVHLAVAYVMVSGRVAGRRRRGRAGRPPCLAAGGCCAAASGP